MTRARIATAAAWPLAMLVAAVSLGGLLSSAYARETPAWTAQAIGQDWFDLLIASPWLAICGVGAARGSPRWRVLLAGAYAYTVYEMVIYAFAVHFNGLFLLYCATLGISGFALGSAILELRRAPADVDPRRARFAGAFLVAVGVVFGAMWLAEDVPAMLRHRPPQTLVDTGLMTNPVHVIDLAFVLPLHVLAGVWLWRRREAGAFLAPIVLSFGVVMAASIGGMLIVMRATPAVAVAMLVVAAASALVLQRLLAHRANSRARETVVHRLSRERFRGKLAPR